MVVVCAVLLLVSAAAFPLIRGTARQQKEIELRLALSKLRRAVDEYKRFCEAGLLGELELGSNCWPADFELLLEPVQLVGQSPESTFRFLRRIPIDPMTGEAEWGLRGYEDDPDTDYWSGVDIYDVYSQSTRTGLNGIPYNAW